MRAGFLRILPGPGSRWARRKMVGRLARRTQALSAAILFIGAPGGHAQFEERPKPAGSPPLNSPIKEVAPGVFQLGKVTLNKTDRTVSFPAQLNMKEGALEYLVVTDAGKIHESLLRTDTEPYHIHLAMLLLGLKGAGTNNVVVTNAAAIPGDKVTLEVSWLSPEREVKRRAESMVENRFQKKPMTPGPWVYTGSTVIEGGFVAQQEGSIASIIVDPGAVINNPRPEADNDEAWMVHTNGLPPLNWPVKVTIQVQGK